MMLRLSIQPGAAVLRRQLSLRNLRHIQSAAVPQRLVLRRRLSSQYLRDSGSGGQGRSLLRRVLQGALLLSGAYLWIALAIDRFWYGPDDWHESEIDDNFDSMMRSYVGAFEAEDKLKALQDYANVLIKAPIVIQHAGANAMVVPNLTKANKPAEAAAPAIQPEDHWTASILILGNSGSVEATVNFIRNRAGNESEWVPVEVVLKRLQEDEHPLVHTSRPLPHGLKYLAHIT